MQESRRKKSYQIFHSMKLLTEKPFPMDMGKEVIFVHTHIEYGLNSDIIFLRVKRINQLN